MNPTVSNHRQQDHRHSRMQLVQSAPTCPACGEHGVTTTWIDHDFEYGSGEESFELQVRIPVRQCGSCEFEYLDDEAERLKHNAICDHLGVLSPDEIRRIRQGYGMTRAAFAQLTGLGEASLNRWENGLSIQTHANDRYLRLLKHAENLLRLRELTTVGCSSTPIAGVFGGRFRAVEVTDVLLKEQSAFRLRIVA